MQFCRSWPNSGCSWQESAHTRLTRRRTNVKITPVGKRFKFKFQQTFVNLCFMRETKKLPMHGIANVLSITCPAAWSACWVLSISCKLRTYNSKKHSWFTINTYPGPDPERIPAHDSWSCCCHWVDPDTPRSPRRWNTKINSVKDPALPPPRQNIRGRFL